MRIQKKLELKAGTEKKMIAYLKHLSFFFFAIFLHSLTTVPPLIPHSTLTNSIAGILIIIQSTDYLFLFSVLRCKLI